MARKKEDREGADYFRKGSKEYTSEEMAFQLNPERKEKAMKRAGGRMYK